MPDRSRVVVVTGCAPYLGGPATWAPLRAAAPEYDFLNVDLLAIAEAPDLAAAQHQALTNALTGSAAIIAHFSAAKGAIEAVATVDPSLPVLLVSPLLVSKVTPPLAVLRAAAGPAGGLLNALGAAKLRRLRTDSGFAREQLARLVAERAIDDELLSEAAQRIADRRTQRAVERTAEVLRFILAPVDPNANRAVSNRIVLVGNSVLDRKIARRMPCTPIEGAGSAAMLEAPKLVAQHLRALLNVA